MFVRSVDIKHKANVAESLKMYFAGEKIDGVNCGVCQKKVTKVNGVHKFITRV